MNVGKIITFDGPYTEKYYNRFFNPNICHVCKLPSRNLITCIKCYMISYCRQEHQTLDKNSHMSICRTFAREITSKLDWNICFDSKTWAVDRIEIINKLNLSLHVYQKDMILCAISCYQCHRQINLKPCVICYSANFCGDHQMLFNLEHKNKCEQLLISLNINIACIKTNVLQLCLSKLTFTTFPDARPYYNMISFINRYLVRPDLDDIEIEKGLSRRSFWSLEDYICSDYVTSPLTLHYALQASNLLSLPCNVGKYIVHVIDANETDVSCLMVWHIFLHLFSNIKELYIVFIKSPKFESCELGTVCSRCCNYNQKLYVVHVSEPYPIYRHLKSYIQPNVIIIFDTDMYSIRTWFESIRTIIAQMCPLLVTVNDETRMHEDINKIQVVTGTTRNYFCGRNKFRSLRPNRCYIPEEFYFRHAYFIIYT